MLELRNYDSKWYYTTLRYDAQGRVTGYEYGNGLVNTVDYNPLTGRIDDSRIWNASVEVSHYGFTYDRLGLGSAREL